MKRKITSLKALGFVAVLSACGQDPSFVDLERKDKASSITGDRSADSSADEGNTGGIDDTGEGGGGILGDVIGDGPNNQTVDNGSGGGGGTNGGGVTPRDPDDIVIPDTTPEQSDAIKKCMIKWGSNNPFPQTITNVKKLVAVTVGGVGVSINDTETTQDPQLVLILAGVNVGGAPVYNLMNPNAYYCMAVNVNVNTDLTINLNCNARLADSLVNVAIGSTMTDNTARIGVHVNSKVTINTKRPSGQECIR